VWLNIFGYITKGTVMKSYHASSTKVTILISYPTMTELTFCGFMSVYPTVGLYGHTAHDFILLLTHASFASFKTSKWYNCTMSQLTILSIFGDLQRKCYERFLWKTGALEAQVGCTLITNFNLSSKTIKNFCAGVLKLLLQGCWTTSLMQCAESIS
jgi:hypothetical protein